MHVDCTRLLSGLAMIALLAGCQRPPSGESAAVAFRSAVAGAEWELIELGGEPAPTVGPAARRPTLRFESDTARASGWAGCNRYTGAYTADASTLRFSELAMTRMACAEGMELESRFGESLQATRAYDLEGGELVLYGDAGRGTPLARFRRAGS